jgi:hypothetical protein
VGGRAWIEALDGFIRATFTHFKEGATAKDDDGRIKDPRDTFTVVSVSDGDDVFYGLVAAMVNDMLFNPETLGMAAARQNDVELGELGRGRSMRLGAGTLSRPNSAAERPSAGGSSSSPYRSPSRMGVPANSAASPSGARDRIFENAQRRRAPTRQGPVPDGEETHEMAPPLAADELDAFHCILEFVHSSDRSDELIRAMTEVDILIHKCRLYSSTKALVIGAKFRAERYRGTLECRQHVRDACCALERYFWLIIVAVVLLEYRKCNPQLFGAAASDSPALSFQQHATTPLLLRYMEFSDLANPLLDFIREKIDPWARDPQQSPDPLHNKNYSYWPARWHRPMYVPCIL